MTDSCAGACCAVFPLDACQADRILKYGEASNITDAVYIADMIIPLTRDEAVARYARLGYGELPTAWKDDGQHSLWTCRHWDEETRLCGAYEARPVMCKGYPYGATCERGCGYEHDPDPSPVKWEWDGAAKGWRAVFRSTDKWIWDGELVRANNAGQSERPEGSTNPS